MMRNLPKLQDEKKLSIPLNDFKGGSNTLLSETRIRPNEAKEILNLMLIEDGVWTKRWGSAQYGDALPDPIDGFSEYIKQDGTRELIVIAGGLAYRSPDGEGWEQISGGTFASGKKCRFHQYNGFLYIIDGENPINRYDGTSMVTYTPIDTPVWAGTPLARGAGLSAGDYEYFYRVSAVNEVGETIASIEESITVNKLRNTWTGATEIITLDWNPVAGAQKYIIYFSDLAGYEVYLDEVLGDSYVDNGAATPNPFIEPSLDDTTGGPILSSISSSGNRLWGVGADNKVYYSGNVGEEKGSFGVHSGGGWIGIERGGRGRLTTVVDFQNDPHVFMTYPEGSGQIWRIEESSVIIGGDEITIMIPVKILDATGTKSVGATIYVENDVFYWDNGVRVLGNEPGVLNVLRTNELSSRIRPYIQSLRSAEIRDIEAIYFDSKVFFSVSRNSDAQDRTVVYDRERLAWIQDWDIGVSQWGIYTDNSMRSRLLGSTENRLITFNQNYLNDSGVGFRTKYVSPRIQFSKDDFKRFVKIFKTYVRMRKVGGSVNITIRGTGKSHEFKSIASTSVTAGDSTTGLSWEQLSNMLFSDSSGTPEVFQSESLIRVIRVNKLVRDIQIQIETQNSGDMFTLIGVIFEGLPVQTGDPASWRIT